MSKGLIFGIWASVFCLSCQKLSVPPPAVIASEDETSYILWNGDGISTGPQRVVNKGALIIDIQGRLIYESKETENIACLNEGFFLKERRPLDENQLSTSSKPHQTFIDVLEQKVLPIDIESEYRIDGCFSNGLARVTVKQGESESYAFINTKGELSELPKFDAKSEIVGDFYEGFAIVAPISLPGEGQKSWYFIDTNGKRYTPDTVVYVNDYKTIGVNPEFDGIRPKGVRFSDGFASFDGIYLDSEGKVVINKRDKYNYTMPFNERIALVERKNDLKSQADQWVAIDTTGQEIFELPENITVESLDFYHPWLGFSEGLMPIVDRETGLMGYLDRAGKISIKPQFKDAKHFKYGFASVVTQDNKKAFINKKGDVLDVDDRGIPIFWDQN